MKIMMSAGEASGDMHAAAVAAEIKREYPDADIFGMGGDNMRNAGVRIIYDIGNLGIIGVVEVIRHLSLFFKLRTFLRHAMMEEKPDVVVCVDYPGFNMKIAHVAKELGIPGTRDGQRILFVMWSMWHLYFPLKRRLIEKLEPR